MNWNQWKKEINEHKWNSKNCLERDLNPRPRLSSADVLTTTPPRQPRQPHIYICSFSTQYPIYELFYSTLFNMDLNTILFRRPTKRWPTHQLNSKYTEASLEFIYIHQQHDLSRFERKTVYVCKLMIGRLNSRRNFRLCLQVEISSLSLLTRLIWPYRDVHEDIIETIMFLNC